MGRKIVAVDRVFISSHWETCSLHQGSSGCSLTSQNSITYSLTLNKLDSYMKVVSRLPFQVWYRNKFPKTNGKNIYNQYMESTKGCNRHTNKQLSHCNLKQYRVGSTTQHHKYTSILADCLLLSQLYFFTINLIAIFQYIELAERAGGIHVQPLVYAGWVKMVATGEFTQFSSIVIGTKANTTFLKSEKETFRSQLLFK